MDTSSFIHNNFYMGFESLNSPNQNSHDNGSGLKELVTPDPFSLLVSLT